MNMTTNERTYSVDIWFLGERRKVGGRRSEKEETTHNLIEVRVISLKKGEMSVSRGSLGQSLRT